MSWLTPKGFAAVKLFVVLKEKNDNDAQFNDN